MKTWSITLASIEIRINRGVLLKTMLRGLVIQVAPEISIVSIFSIKTRDVMEKDIDFFFILLVCLTLFNFFSRKSLPKYKRQKHF